MNTDMRIVPVVAAVNRLRRSVGLDPIPDLVPGRPNSSCECPIKRSLALGAAPDPRGLRTVTASSGGLRLVNGPVYRFVVRREVPTAISRFIDLFDSGEHGRSTFGLNRYHA